VRNNFKPNITMCRHNNRNLILNKEVLRRQVEYFNEVLKGEEEGGKLNQKDTRQEGRRYKRTPT
jgi:hypothetical protein